ncbi:MAG TPA: DUF4136 domain-containing protein [Verrucomicrobiae bacterium]|nr:DUF4136 domain-containing protein [Verrucomicrobiae bacterium]
MRLIYLMAFMALGAPAFAQEVQFDYNRSASFNTYRTYQWLPDQAVPVGGEILDRNIKRAVDEQLSSKGLQRVEIGGDLLVAYQAEIKQEKGSASILGPARIATSTIDIGRLVVELSEQVTRQVIWRGSASKAAYATVDIGRNPDEVYRCLARPVAKLFRNYPPRMGKRYNCSPIAQNDSRD